LGVLPLPGIAEKLVDERARATRGNSRAASRPGSRSRRYRQAPSKISTVQHALIAALGCRIGVVGVRLGFRPSCPQSERFGVAAPPLWVRPVESHGP
jgi:hypothetical protein